MVNFDPTTLAVFLGAILTIAAVAGVLALGAASGFVASNRKQRLATHDTIRHYYGSFVLAR